MFEFWNILKLLWGMYECLIDVFILFLFNFMIYEKLETMKK